MLIGDRKQDTGLEENRQAVMSESSKIAKNSKPPGGLNFELGPSTGMF